ncbi:MAG: hypothetical protein HFH31_01175 [Bacilli bacterium]|jgi:hypothetical protein|nr:hypothetical protein [Bacilli bacterium]
MKKLLLNNPSLNVIKEKLSNDLPEEIEITFNNKVDNGIEFMIMDYLINSAGYSIEEVKPIDDSKTMYIVYFKRKS